MKIQSILFLLLLFLATFSQAQVRFGIKAGFSTTSIEPNDLNIFNQNGVKELGIALNDAKYGIHFGGLVRVGLGSFFVQPEFLFNSNKNDFTVTDFSSGGSTPKVLSESYQYLDIPLLVGFQFNPIRLYIGPEGHIFISSDSDLSNLNNFKDDFNNMTLAWQGGIGLDIWNLMVDLRYEGNFSKFGDHFTFFGNSYDFDQSPSRLLVSVGWLFGKK